MVFVGAGLGRGIALALLRDDMQQDGALIRIADVPKDRDEMIEIMAIDRPDIVKAELVEQGATREVGARMLDGPGDRPVHPIAELARQLPAGFPHRQVGLARQETCQIGGHGANGRRDRHFIVVEDDDEPGTQRAGIVHGLVGHARRHGAIADHRDDMTVLLLEVARDRETERGGNRGRGMGSAESIIFALAPLREAGDSASLPKRAHAVAAAGQDLVGIGLMPDIPDECIAWRIENMVQRHRQFDHAEAGAKMPARDGNSADGFGPQFRSDLHQIRSRERAKISGSRDQVKERRFWHRLTSAIACLFWMTFLCPVFLTLSGIAQGENRLPHGNRVNSNASIAVFSRQSSCKINRMGDATQHQQRSHRRNRTIGQGQAHREDQGEPSARDDQDRDIRQPSTCQVTMTHQGKGLDQENHDGHIHPDAEQIVHRAAFPKGPLSRRIVQLSKPAVLTQRI